MCSVHCTLYTVQGTKKHDALIPGYLMLFFISHKKIVSPIFCIGLHILQKQVFFFFFQYLQFNYLIYLNTNSQINQLQAMLCYAMLCYAMLDFKSDIENL